MAKLTGNIRVLAAAGTPPVELMRRLNATFASSEADIFVTLLYAVLDHDRHTLTIANAGHYAPMVRRRDRTVIEACCESGYPLGILDEATFSQTEFRLEPQDRVCAFTDGIVEAMNEQMQPYGFEKLVRTLSEAPSSPHAILERIQQSIWEHTGSAEQSDDLTLVCFGPIEGNSRQ